MTQALLSESAKESKRSTPSELMKSRQTAELIFVIIEPLGGGAKAVASTLQNMLTSQSYLYEDVNIIEISQIIEEQAQLRGYAEPELQSQLKSLPPLSEKTLRCNRLQQWGNKLRAEDGADFLAKHAIRLIAKYRRENENVTDEPLRVAHIIRSLKNEHELELLRKLYGNMLIAIAVSADYEKQLMNFFEIPPRGKERVQDDESQRLRFELEFSKLANIDQYEGIENGQRVRKVFYQSDLFLNDGEALKDDIKKFLELLFGTHIHHPNTHESMIFKAFAASLQSTCLSRQVGAAIANEYGELISIGWNDVPGCNGGLAQAANELEYKASCKYKQVCNSQKEVNKIKKSLFDRIKESNIIKGKPKEQEQHLAKLKEIIDESEISSLTEFSRAVHAEMEAILHAARNRIGDLRKATLYVTTYPCENCVKHILAAGIKKIIYIEPYPKSRALEFYQELINSHNDQRSPEKLDFIQFTGISPSMYSKYFKMNTERKNPAGKMTSVSTKPFPLTVVYMDSFSRYESEIANDLITREEEILNAK